MHFYLYILYQEKSRVTWSYTHNIQVLMLQFISMVREAFPITSFIPVPGMREMEALGNSTAVTCILQHKGDKGEKRKCLYFVSPSEHKTSFKFWSNTNCPQREYLPWHVVFDITKPKFLIATQIREMLLLHILLQDFQPNLLGYRKTVISSVAFDTAWSLDLHASGLGWTQSRKEQGISFETQQSISDLNPIASHGNSWTYWFSIWNQMNLYMTYCSVKQLPVSAILCS